MERPVLLIMAAGMGSRYGGLKQIDPITKEGEIILDFSLFDAYRAGFRDAVFVIKRENEADFRALIDQSAGRKMNVQYAFQEKDDIPEREYTAAEQALLTERQKPWGTGHAVMAARHLIRGPFAVINADDYYGVQAFKQLYDFLSSAEAAREEAPYRISMVGFEIEKTLSESGHVSRGVCSVSPEGRLTGIIERTMIRRVPELAPAGSSEAPVAYSEDGGTSWNELAPGTRVSMNCWGFPRPVMDEFTNRFPAFFEKALIENPLKGEYFLPAVVEALLNEEKATVQVLPTADQWYGVTYREDKESIVKALAAMKEAGVYPRKLWE
ncbi:MAG: nucleotidyltransferase [Clostridia bacterium]|nr:nucleotidyltransferase [Clostridia bacterium]